jgi:hypothetical protein
MRSLLQHPKLAAIGFWLLHFGSSAIAYLVAATGSIGFLDSGGTTAPVWLKLAVGAAVALLQPLAYWVISDSPSAWLGGWDELGALALLGAANSALVTALVALGVRVVRARPRA